MPPHSRPKRSRDAGSSGQFHWRAAALILPWLAEHRARITLAMLCLVLAKAGGIGAPFLLKRAVDALNPGTAAGAAVVSVIALVVAYGFARFLNVLLAEIRDTVFGRVTERAMHRIGLRVF